VRIAVRIFSSLADNLRWLVALIGLCDCSRVTVGDIWGTRKRQNGDAGKPLTDAREKSYLI